MEKTCLDTKKNRGNIVSEERLPDYGETHPLCSVRCDSPNHSQ